MSSLFHVALRPLVRGFGVLELGIGIGIGDLYVEDVVGAWLVSHCNRSICSPYLLPVGASNTCKVDDGIGLWLPLLHC